jgi:hypothetical protein
MRRVIQRCVVLVVAVTITLISTREARASASGGGITVVTYTGGCRAGWIDINPQLQINRGARFVHMYAALYTAQGRILRTSGTIVYQTFYGPARAAWPRWYGGVPSGGAYVKVYVKNEAGRLLLVDTARCRT